MLKIYFSKLTQQNQHKLQLKPLNRQILNIMELKSKDNMSKNESILTKSQSVLSVSPSLKSRYSLNDQGIMRMMSKLNGISQSVEISASKRNPLNLIQYEMQSERSKQDPQMILANLRKLENRAETHRADVQINQFDQEKSKQHKRKKKSHCHSRNDSNQKRMKKQLNYLKIYQTYLTQKQMETKQRQRFQDDEYPIKNDDEELGQTNNGIKYFSTLKKLPRLLDLTLTRQKTKQGTTEKELHTERKSVLTRKIREINEAEQFIQQKDLQQQKQNKRQYQNPEKIIQRQITKFYLKKNPGKLSHEANQNQRSLNLINKQKKISFKIDQDKICKEDRKKPQFKFNDLVNQLVRSDRRKSLEGLLPKLKQQYKVQTHAINEKKAKIKLFDNQQASTSSIYSNELHN